MKLKTGDNVKIASGAERGKTGKIIQVFRQLDRVVVDGINRRVRHLRPRRRGEKGEKIEFFAPLAAAKVRLICPSCGKPTRINQKIVVEPTGQEKKIRICKKCRETI